MTRSEFRSTAIRIVLILIGAAGLVAVMSYWLIR